MKWREYGFKSKEEFIEWIRKSPSKEVKEKLGVSDEVAYRLRKCVSPLIYSILSKKEYSTREMKEKLEEVGINHSFKFLQRLRSEGVKFGIFERKLERWTKEKLDKLLREEAKKHGGKLTYKDIPRKVVTAAQKLYGSWNNALEANGISISRELVSKNSLLQVIEKKGVCLFEELCISRYPEPVRMSIKELEEEGKVRTRKLKVEGRSRKVVYLPGEEEEVSSKKLEEKLKEIRKKRENALRRFKSREELIEWIRKSPPRVIAEKMYLSLDEVSKLKMSVKPEIFSVISDPKLTLEKMVQKLKEKGIESNFDRVCHYRAVATKIGLIRRRCKTYPHLEELIFQIIKEEGGYCLTTQLDRDPRISKLIVGKYVTDTVNEKLRKLEEKGKVKITKSRQYRIVYLPEKEEEVFEFEQRIRAEATKKGLSSLYRKKPKGLEGITEKADTGEIILGGELKEREKRFVSHLVKSGRFSFVPREIGNLTFYSTNPKNLEDLEKVISYLEGD